MKIIVVGATGTIGAAVAKALAANKHEVVAASRLGAVKVNLDEPASIRALFETVRESTRRCRAPATRCSSRSPRSPTPTTNSASAAS